MLTSVCSEGKNVKTHEIFYLFVPFFLLLSASLTCFRVCRKVHENFFLFELYVESVQILLHILQDLFPYIIMFSSCQAPLETEKTVHDDFL